MPLHGRLSLLPAAAALIGDPRPQILTRGRSLVFDLDFTFRRFENSRNVEVPPLPLGPFLRRLRRLFQLDSQSGAERRRHLFERG